MGIGNWLLGSENLHVHSKQAHSQLVDGKYVTSEDGCLESRILGAEVGALRHSSSLGSGSGDA